ncbi:MAG: PKD domain-containing protein, partial [Saprospiraceae bacterium]|nr:PKD domain-containing protein [Saprospiraceae bacterium]
MRSIISSLLPFTFLALFLSVQSLQAQCGQNNWTLNNDCGDIQAFGGLAPNQPTIFCVGEIVNVENNSSPASEITATYIDWDDGNCESFQGMPSSFSHVYVFPTDTCYNGGQITFMVRMGVEKDCGTDKSFNFITFPVAVRFKPLVIVTASDILTCTGSEIDFTSSVCANGTLQYQWFIEGDTFTSKNVPDYVFDNPGTYNVSLVVTNSCGQGGHTIGVVSSGPASAAASASVNDVCVQDTVVFYNSSANAISQTWNISPGSGWSYVNGTNNHSLEPELVFNSPGAYVVHLAVDGCGDPEWQDTIFVLEPPGLDLPQIPDACDVGPFVYFPDAVISGSMPEVMWEFQGGSPASASGLQPDSVIFSGVGEYVVSASVTVAGCGTVSQSDTFSIINLPTVSLQPVADLCNSDVPIQLVSDPTGDGWSGPGVSKSGMFYPGLVPDSLLNQKVPIVFQTGTGDCLVRDTLFIQVNGQAVDAGPDKEFCLDAGVQAFSASPVGGSWTGTGISADGKFDPLQAGAGPHELVYAVYDPVSDCVSTDTIMATVQALPDAALDALGNLCVGTSIDLGTVFAGSGGSICHWDFGDGSSADICDPEHTYQTIGTYTLSLMVENTAGCRDTAIGMIDIVPPPTAVFTTDQTAGCADLSVNIVNESGMSGALYIWDFGNGQQDTIEQPGFMVFGTGQHDTTYTIVLQATNSCGTATQEEVITVHPRPQVNFGTNFSNGCSPMEVDFNNVSVGEPDFFNWFINGIQVDTGFQLAQQIFYAFNQDSTYFVSLVAGNECGIDTITHPVLVHPNPVSAFFNTDHLSGCQPLTVQLIDYSTNGTNISWNLGDGNLATGDTVVHEYTLPGDYTIYEYANNGCGFDTANVVITVLPQPAVSFAHDAYGCQGDTLQLVNTSVNLAGSIWDFGDGSHDSTHTSPVHVYPNIGFYTITLTGTSVTNACTASVSHTIEVKPLPSPSASVIDSFGCEPFELHTQNTSSGTNFYVWDFGDGSFSTEYSPVHIYEEAGVYTLTMEMTDLFGCQNAWAFAPVNVFPKPTVQFSYDQAELCVTPAVIQLQNQSENADNYL